MDDLLLEYRDKFGENFPIFCFMGIDEEEVKKVIRECLDEGVAFDTDSIPNEVY
ncbi:MAG: hypothetical protein II816_03915 [Elusimicrobia bacterium]|nr:hypothetical protein [Elusimicrobiota bacterium]